MLPSQVNNNHIIFSSIKEIGKISDVLNNCVQFLSYAKIYDDGNEVSLTRNKNWLRHFLKNYWKPQKNIPRLKIGVNYWKQNTSTEISEIAQDARDNFDIDARIEFVYRDNPNKCYYIYSFSSNRKNADRAYKFYGMHTIKLIKFIAYFNREAAHLIAEANKPENHIIIPNYIPPNLPEKTRDFITEMKTIGAAYKLGDRETEALLLYAAGYTAKQIGKMFHRSPKTIEKHIEHIKNKTGCKDRKDLHAYVQDIGLAGMERFFFNYFTHE